MANFLAVERFTDKKSFFRIQKWGWRLIGFWPGSDVVTRLQLALAVLNILEVLIYGVFQFTFCYVNRGNLVVLLDALTPWLTQITSSFKVAIIIWNRRDIKVVLDYLMESFSVGMEKIAVWCSGSRSLCRGAERNKGSRWNEVESSLNSSFNFVPHHRTCRSTALSPLIKWLTFHQRGRAKAQGSTVDSRVSRLSSRWRWSSSATWRTCFSGRCRLRKTLTAR